MSRRARNQTTVSLFPFLAVLLCAMGALLVLLVITTRQIRDDARRQATVRQLEAAPPVPPEAAPEPAYEWPDLEVALGPSEELERRTLPTPPPAALMAPKPVFVKRETDPPPPDLTAELQQLRQQIQQASSQVASSQQAVKDAQQRRAALLAEVEKRKDVLKNAEQAIAGFQSQRQQLSREEAVLEEQSATMTRNLQRLQAETAEIANHPRNPANVLKVVPYDGQQGTTRRPILLECSNNKIRFVPEGIELTERDLVGFSLDRNPLLAGVLAAEKYWMKRNQAEGNLNRPYVLMIVRPDGIAAYYAARQLLQEYPHESGYELLTGGQKLSLPPIDPTSQQTIAQAVQRLLQQRGGTPALARSPFPQVDPKLLERLRSGQESLADEAGAVPGSGSGPGAASGSQPPTPGHSPGKRFKFVQTSQGLKMIPINDSDLKRFDIPGSPGEGAVSETRSAPGSNENPAGGSRDNLSPNDLERKYSAGNRYPVASRTEAEPPPLPTPPAGTPIRNLNSGQPNSSEWSSLDSDSRPPTIAAADSPGQKTPYDPTQVPDAWTPLLEGQPHHGTESSTASGQQGGASSPSAANAGSRGQGPTSPFGAGGTLAFKRTIDIKISGTHMRVASRNTLVIPAGVSAAQLMSATVAELRKEVHSWKEPPEQFYWKPAVRFLVFPGGSQYVEQLKPAFEKQGLLSGVTYMRSEQASDPNWRPTQR